MNLLLHPAGLELGYLATSTLLLVWHGRKLRRRARLVRNLRTVLGSPT